RSYQPPNSERADVTETLRVAYTIRARGSQVLRSRKAWTGPHGDAVGASDALRGATCALPLRGRNRDQPVRIARKERDVLSADDARHRSVRAGLVDAVAPVDDLLEGDAGNGEAARERAVDLCRIGRTSLEHRSLQNADHFEAEPGKAAAWAV